MNDFIVQKLLPQLLGLVGMVFLFCSYQQTKRERLIACKLGSDVMWVLHYLCLGAYGGAIPNFVGIFRELVFMQQKKYKWARCPVWPALFILINLTLALLTWKSALTLLPITASAFVTVALWAKKPRVTRMIGVPVSICFLIYDIFVGSWIGVVNESIAIISIATSFFRNDLKQLKTGLKETK